jgi:hypothetical protein
MKYILLMYANEADSPYKTPEQLQKVRQDWITYMQEANAAGIVVSNNGISPDSNATTVRVRNGKTLVSDGPFAETHEQLAGFTVLECKDIDEALHWAAKIPTATYGSIEVRPLWQNQ